MNMDSFRVVFWYQTTVMMIHTFDSSASKQHSSSDSLNRAGLLVTAVPAEQDSQGFRVLGLLRSHYKRFNPLNPSSCNRYIAVYCYAFPADHRLSDNSIESGLEPFDGILLGDLV